jgi:hypothetical protein
MDEVLKVIREQEVYQESALYCIGKSKSANNTKWNDVGWLTWLVHSNAIRHTTGEIFTSRQLHT